MLEQNNRPSQTTRREYYEQRERQQFIAVLILFVAVSIIIGALYLVQATTNVSNARDIQQLRDQRSRLQRENEALKADIARLNSIDGLMTRAANLGFVTAGPESMLWMEVEGYVYDLPAPTLTPVPISPTPLYYEDNFAGWMRRQVDWLRDQFAGWSEEE